MRREDDPVSDAIGALLPYFALRMSPRSVPSLPAPLHYAACLSGRADTISIAQGAELLTRNGSDACTTGVVPLELGNCRHGKYLAAFLAG